MKKKELIERIAQEAGVPKSEVHKHFEEVVTEALKGCGEVQITSFGMFSVKERMAREGTHPQTGQKMKIAAQRARLQRRQRPQRGGRGAPRARKQEAYFAIGELTDEEAQGFNSNALAEALERMRRERAGGTEGIAAEMHHGLSGADEIESLALSNN